LRRHRCLQTLDYTVGGCGPWVTFASSSLGSRIDHFQHQASGFNLHAHVRTDGKTGFIQPKSLQTGRASGAALDTAAGKRGPAPKLRQQMERVQRLPKAQQGLVMQMINAVLAQRDR